jgi:hypothetical protein
MEKAGVVGSLAVGRDRIKSRRGEKEVASHYRVKETGLVRFARVDERRRLMACVTWEVGWATSPSRNLPERA